MCRRRHRSDAAAVGCCSGKLVSDRPARRVFLLRHGGSTCPARCASPHSVELHFVAARRKGKTFLHSLVVRPGGCCRPAVLRAGRALDGVEVAHAAMPEGGGGGGW